MPELVVPAIVKMYGSSETSGSLLSMWNVHDHAPAAMGPRVIDIVSIPPGAMGPTGPVQVV
jgi:hypothetical protein